MQAKQNDPKGKVYLVGAGPGDPGLFTLKAAQILAKAQVVVYDRLVGVEILAQIPAQAEKINVGKNAGNHPVPQEEINQILLQKALENKLVVRLKGGDPFLFGRGGEELELLVAHHIPFEVIPGVTSAMGAPAYAGIPVTHRDFCSSLHLITGHAKKDGSLDIAYDALVRLKGTLVFMMSVGSIPHIVAGLLGAGMDLEMPAAVIENGTRTNQRSFVTKLCDLTAVMTANQVQSPAIIVVGKVCSLATDLDWFGHLPLKGCKVLVTRPKAVAGKLAVGLRDLGAEVTEYPCIRTQPLPFDLQLQHFDWLFFTSAVGVHCFFQKLAEEGLDSRCLFGKKIAVVGTETAGALATYGIREDFTPSVFDGEHLAAELLATGKLTAGQKVGLFRAKIGSKKICAVLKAGGVALEDISVYETVYLKNPLPMQVIPQSFDYLAFTSASCVKAFAGSFGDSVDYSKLLAVCIGKQTAGAAVAMGMQVILADVATVAGMIEKIKEVN